MVGDHQVGRRQPLRPAGLGDNPGPEVVGAHPPFQRTLETHLIGGVDHHPGPEETGLEDRHLDHRHPVKTLQLGPDHAEYVRVSQSPQLPELARIREHDVGQPSSIDHTIAQRLRPAVGHRGKGLACRLEHSVAHPVSVDHPDPGISEELAHFALPGADPTREHPATVLCSHLARR